MNAIGVVDSVLKIVSALVPGALALATSKPSDEEAIASVLAAAKALPQRETTGGTWAKDLAERVEGGTRE